MKMALITLVVLTAAVIPVVGAPKKAVSLPPVENPACAGLAAEYENASKQIALNAAENLSDDSAIRVNMRETQNGNTLEKARITVDLMKANSCKMPTAAPSAAPYLSAALDCNLALSQQVLDRSNAGIRSYDTTNMPPRPQACEMSTWKAHQ